jgi:hypothetical protein
MRRRSGSHVIRSFGRSTGDAEDKWYDVVRYTAGVADHRPSSGNAIQGLTKAQREADRQTAALPDEQRARTEFRLEEVPRPRLRRIRRGRPKYDDRKTPR